MASRSTNAAKGAAPKVVEKKVVGKGAYGSAILCKDEAGDQLIKKNIKCRNYREVRDAKKEAQFLEDLKSTNVIGYKAMEQKNAREVNIFMEFADGGDLSSEIEKRAKKRDHYSQDQLMDRFADCVKAVDKMHGKGVVHRDIKPANIFLNKEGQAKMGDFGIARSCSKNGRVRTPIGTPLYLDPQRAGGREYGQKADMWSLGCVLYEMAALKPAFDARSMPELKRKVARGQVDMGKIPASYDPEVKKLISNMLQVSEEKRSSVAEVGSNAMVKKAVRSRSSSSSSDVWTADGGDMPVAAKAPALAPIAASPQPARRMSPTPPVEPKPAAAKAMPQPTRGRAREIQQQERRARSHSPMTGAPRGARDRSRSNSREPASRNRGARSVSPVTRAPRRDSAVRKGPSPLAGGGDNNNVGTPAGKLIIPSRKDMTPDHPDVSHAISNVMHGKNQNRAINRALDQLGAGRARKGAHKGPWALPPIQATGSIR